MSIRGINRLVGEGVTGYTNGWDNQVHWCGTHIKRSVSLIGRTFVPHTRSNKTVPYQLWLEDIYRNGVFIEAT